MINSGMKGIYLILIALIITIVNNPLQVNSQLPDDIQKELNQNLAEQARQQQLQHQINQLQQQQQRQAAIPRQPVAAARGSGTASQDPNNYSFNQVAPPVQYSYYRPYGDNQAQSPQQQQQFAPQLHYNNQQQQQQQQQPQLDLGSFGFNQPAAPQPSYQPNYQQHQQAPPVPNFNMAGGLPTFQGGQLPLQQQQPQQYGAPVQGGAPVQQGPPLTENDFKDITEGQNYGAPGGSDFGLGNVAQNGGQSTGTNTDAQLREFGLPADPGAAAQSGSGGVGSQIPNLNNLGAGSGSAGGDPDLRSLGETLGGGNSRAGGPQQGGGIQIPGLDNLGGQSPGGDLGGFSGSGFPANPTGQPALAGSGFPQSSGPYEASPASSNGNRRATAPVDDGAINISDLGERSDQFAGNNLPGLGGGGGQPNVGGDSDFNYAAASDQQPDLVPYPDAAPQPVGSLFAVTQPQSLTQTRYNPLPDKGTYQDYPAYHFGPNNLDTVSDVVERTPPARAPGPGRYGATYAGP